MTDGLTRHSLKALSVFIMLMAPVGVLAPSGLVPALLLSVVAGFFLRQSGEGIRGAFGGPLLWILSAIAVWALIGGFWALDPPRTMTLAIKLFALCLSGILFIYWLDNQPGARLEKLENAVTVGHFLGLAVLFVGYAYAEITGDSLWSTNSGDPLTTLSRGADILALSIWPAATILWKRERVFAALAAIALTLLSVLLLSNAAVVAGIGAGTAVFIFIFIFRKKAAVAIGCAIAVVILAAPLLMRLVPSGDVMNEKVGAVYTSAVHRIYTWHFVNKKIAERPILGWGLDASRIIPGGRKQLRKDPLTLWKQEILPLHPHNAALQVWLELGLPGAFLFAGFVFLIFFRLFRGRRSHSAAAAMGAVTTVYLVIGSFSFGVWQNWWVAAGWLVAGLMVLAARGTERLSAAG